MENIKEIEVGNYKAIIKKTEDKSFFVMCLQNDNATYGFPFKYYSTLKGAEDYAKKFIDSAGYKKYEVTTTQLRAIMVTAKNEEEAERIASSQFKDGEAVIMIAYKTNI